jgi:large conductance mechanosensitive channel
MEHRMNLKGLWAEFKAFAFKGNMIELAVAVVIGAAFSTVINSLVNDVVMPTVTYVVNTATTAANKAKDVAEIAASRAGFPSSQPTTEPTTQATGSTAAGTAAPQSAPPPAPSAPATPAGPPPPPVQIHLMIGPVNAGAFIGALLNFLLVAAAVFIVIVKLLGSVMSKVSRNPSPSEPTTRECPECLSIIPYKARRCSACTAVVEPLP